MHVGLHPYKAKIQEEIFTEFFFACNILGTTIKIRRVTDTLCLFVFTICVLALIDLKIRKSIITCYKSYELSHTIVTSGNNHMDEFISPLCAMLTPLSEVLIPACLFVNIPFITSAAHIFTTFSNFTYNKV